MLENQIPTFSKGDRRDIEWQRENIVLYFLCKEYKCKIEIHRGRSREYKYKWVQHLSWCKHLHYFWVTEAENIASHTRQPELFLCRFTQLTNHHYFISQSVLTFTALLLLSSLLFSSVWCLYFTVLHSIKLNSSYTLLILYPIIHIVVNLCIFSKNI